MAVFIGAGTTKLRPMLAVQEEGHGYTYSVDEAVHIGSDFRVDRLSFRKRVVTLHTQGCRHSVP